MPERELSAAWQWAHLHSMANGANPRHGAPAQELAVAMEHHQAGRLDRAEAIYRKVLQKNPGNVDALHLLGLAAFNRGHLERAIQLIDRALAAAPNLAPAHINLGNAQRAAGRLADAVASYRRAIALKPDLWDAHSNLALVLCEQGDLAGALTHAERAVQQNPRHPDVLNNFSSTLRALGRLADAEAVSRRAVQIAPGRADLHVNLGNLLIDLRRFDEAAACYRRAIEIQPRLARAHHGLGICQSSTGNAEGAAASFRAAIALASGEATCWNDLGRALRAQGRFDEAAEAFRHALAINPDFADAYRNLATCRQLAASDTEIAHVAALADNEKLPPEERVIAGFALGKACDDADRFDAAFSAYATANAMYREIRAALGERFDPEQLRRQVDETIAAFTPEFFASVAAWGNPSELPVFIVGMPRSGTSLVEQIAASHSRVFGAGELKDIGELAGELGDVPARWRPAEVRRLADKHVERLRAVGPGADRVIDKLPDNVFKLGVIAALFPSARIIFCQRDPRDTALSCFFQKFSPGQLMFSYDLADCGRRIRETERLAAHWHRVLPQRVLDVSYEALVADLEGESRRLIAFLGLAWEPACLDFHLTERTVMTASGWQVRQPLYARSAGRWRHYARHLGPLLAALETDALGEV